MMLTGRRLCQLVLVAIIAAPVTNCGLLLGGPKSETRGSGNLRLTLWVSRSLGGRFPKMAFSCASVEHRAGRFKPS